MNTPIRFASAAVLLALGQGVASSAHAHIVMEGDILSRDNNVLGTAQKMMPCDGPRSAGMTYTFQPGTTITLKVNEGIPHPSYYRIAFDNDGEDAFADPKSIDPIDPNRAGQNQKCLAGNTDDQCGASDFCSFVSTTGPTVLLDNLAPHIATTGSPYTWYVKLPDYECENCTLQVIQVMEDSVAHGAYCPQGSCKNSGASLEDVYHRCINIKLKAGATNSPGASTMPPTTSTPACTPGVNPNTDAGTADGGTSNSGGGSVSTDAGGSSGGSDGSVAAVGADGGVRGDAGVNGDAGTAPGTGGGTGADDGGCSVHAGRRANDTLFSLLVGLGLVAVVRRRRKRAA